MTRDQIDSWARAGESDVLEFKQTTGERKDAARALCAMLNHRGGKVLFGVRPDGTVSGQQMGDRTLEEVAQEIREIDPPAFPSFDRIPVAPHREVLVVSVTQGANRPYVYKGKPYKRVGNTSPEMSRDEYNRMLLERLHGESRWENQPAAGWTVADLDVAELTRSLEEGIRRGRMEDPGTRQAEDIVRGLGLLREGQLLRAAAVLFGRPEKLSAEFPQCLLRVAKFRGTDKTEFLDNRQFHGHAFDLLLRAERFLRENLPVAGRVVPELFERVDDPLYPPVALREALANAFAHRDYSIGGGSVAVAIYHHRLEITSSGTLHFGLTVADLFRPHESLPWNPLVARVFYRRGVIEAWGRGTLRIAELAAKAHLPPPEIEESAGCVTVRFLPSQYIPPNRVGLDLSDRQQQILQLLERHGRMAVRQIAQHLGCPPRPIRDDLAMLKHLRQVTTVGHGRGAVWFLAEK